MNLIIVSGKQIGVACLERESRTFPFNCKGGQNLLKTERLCITMTERLTKFINDTVTVVNQCLGYTIGLVLLKKVKFLYIQIH